MTSGHRIVQAGNAQLDVNAQRMAHIARQANEYAQAAIFNDAKLELADRTLKIYEHQLKGFESFLNDTFQLQVSGLFDTPTAWVGMTWGLVDAYKKQALSDGMSISELNLTLSAIRKFSGLAVSSGSLGVNQGAMIKTVKGYSGRIARNVNEKRSKSKGRKSTNTLDKAQLRTIEKTLDRFKHTPVGIRDQFLFCLLFRHGLRASEIVALEASNFKGGVMSFYRRKTDDHAKHNLEKDTRRKLAASLALTGCGPFLQGGKRGGHLSGKALTTRTLSNIVKGWGKHVGVKDLSPHDARHSLATIQANRKGITTAKLLDFFGWSSISTAQRYIETSEVQNVGMGRAF